jgi:FMN phosphatase YigB (HAD superfamily)
MSKKQVVTFDWDDCLFEDPAYQIGSLWAPTGMGPEPITRVHELLRKKYEEGFEIHVVTFRKKEHLGEVKHLIGLYELPIKSVVCTEGKSKTLFLKELESTLHVDDSVEVCILAEQAGIKALLVDWKQEDINSTASLLDRI